MERHTTRFASVADVERKLTTIMAADVAGYSAMMERDEERTMATLRQHRATMQGFIERHRGRIANTAGDSVMAEFPSVLEAVSAAAEIQQELGVRNARMAPDDQMQFRIGINLGDVMVEGDDLFGEGVNLAARLETMAEPGGICISGTVYDQVKNKLSLEYDFLGAQQVKNISEEIPVYRVRAVPTVVVEEQPTDAEEAPEGLAETLGSLGERLGHILEEKVESTPDLADRLESKFDGSKLGDLIEEKVAGMDFTTLDNKVVVGRPRSDRKRRPVQWGLIGLVVVMAVFDALVGDGWWVQWPAIFVATLVGLRLTRGIWSLVPLAGSIVLIDWANGGGWWSHWVAGGAAALIVLSLASRRGRTAD